MMSQTRQQHLLTARAARAESRQRLRARDAPKVRAAQQRGLSVCAIRRETGLSYRYVKSLLEEMKLTASPTLLGRPRKDAVRPGEQDEGAERDPEQARFVRDTRKACAFHFRDLATAYPGRKLGSLAIPESPAPRFASPL